jgi:N4-gp56 family major capsid protein
MATKNLPSTNSDAGLVGNNVDLISNTTSYAELIKGQANSDLRSRLWSELVSRDAREKNVFAKFIGGEGSGKPITEKRDLSAGGSDKVTFTTVAPIRGQGVRGEEILKNSTDTLDFGTFSVEIDLVRHAVSWTQVLKLMRFTGKTIDQLSAEVMSEWMSRTEQDQIQYALRQSCLNNSTSNVIAPASNAKLADAGLSIDLIQEAKQALIAQGGEPMNTGGDENQEIPGYLFFGPDACLRALRSDTEYLEAIQYADSRGNDNKLFSGSYAKWDNNIIANHNVLIDTARGRQGSPLLPTYYHFNSTAITAGPADAANGVAATDFVIGAIGSMDDWTANFRGAGIKIPGGAGAQFEEDGDATTHYVLGITPTGTHRLFSYVASKASTSHIVLTPAAAQPSSATPVTSFPQGSLFVQANSAGTPIGYILAMGKDAMYYAKGKIYGEQIFHYDDFANSGNEAHLSAVGVQSVYGMAVRQDTRGRIPAVQLIEVARQVPGLSLTQA